MRKKRGRELDTITLFITLMQRLTFHKEAIIDKDTNIATNKQLKPIWNDPELSSSYKKNIRMQKDKKERIQQTRTT